MVTNEQLEKELAKIAPKGKKLKEKKDYVKKTYPQAENFQGIPLYTVLRGYRNF